MAENQSPTPANTPEHDESKPILSGTQPLQQQRDKVDAPPSPAKKEEEPKESPRPPTTPEKKS